MKVEEIYNKLNSALAHTENNFIENIPKILDDIEYFYFLFDIEKESLSIEEAFMNGADLSKQVIKFYMNLIKEYMTHMFDMEVNFAFNKKYLGTGTAAYDEKTNTIHLSHIGLLLNGPGCTNYSEALLHEYRHAMQHKFSKLSDIKDILKLSPKYLLVLRDSLYEKYKRDENPDFYIENYNELYAENDAELFALQISEELLPNLVQLYLEYAKKNNIEVDEQALYSKVSYILPRIKIDISKTKNELKDLDRNIVGFYEEMLSTSLIESSLSLEKQPVDRLIMLDKYIKENPEMQEKYPVLKLMFNGLVPKEYDEIISDMKKLINEYESNNDKIEVLDIPSYKVVEKTYKEQIIDLYNTIIKSDPILYLNYLISENNYRELKIFISKHPQIFEEYKEDIDKIINNDNYDIELRNYLSNFHSKLY